MDLNARVDVICGQKDGRTDGLTDGQTENRTPISHLAKAGATKTTSVSFVIKFSGLDKKHVGLARQASPFLCCF